MKPIKKNQSKWNLKKLYPTDTSWENDLKKIKALVKKLNTYKGHIVTSTDLLNVLTINRSIDYKDMKIFTYAYLKHELFKKNAKYKTMLARSVNNSSLVSAEISWVEKEIAAIPTWRLKKFINLKKLSQHKDKLEMIMQSKNYNHLSRKEERVLSLAKGVFDSFNEIRTDVEINNVKFPKIITSGGKTLSLNHKNITQYYKHSDRNIRKQVYQNKQRAYSRNSSSFAGLLKGHIQSKIIESKTHNNDCPVNYLLEEDSMNREYIENFLKENLRHNHKFTEYFNLKRKKLKVKQLKPYDILACVDTNYKKIKYSEAVSLFFETIEPFGKEYKKIAETAFKDNWIDSVDTLEKKDPSNSGFNFNPYISHPHVFLSYQDDLDSVMTLSHELGHAIHSWKVNKNNSFYRSGVPFTLQETVAFVNEMLILYKIMETSKSQALKNQALWSLRDMFYINITAKAIETEFEIKSYDLVQQNKKWNSHLLCEQFSKIEQKYLKKFVDYKESQGMSWAIGDAAFDNFYSAKYLLAFCVAVNLVDKILEGDQEFINNYNEILKIGATESVISVLLKLGININDSKTLLKNTYNKFESLLS